MKASRRSEQGFALLLVFLMAAAVALLLYKAMPRVAFETERDKEQLLIDRGNQYKRAIQLYYTQFHRYPSSIDDLESTNDKRFLRRRYTDPFTGKDDWRLIHTNGMALTDSKVQTAPAQPNGNGQPGSGTAAGFPGSTPGAATGLVTGAPGATTTPATTTGAATTAGPNAPPQVNATVLARPSDRTLPNSQSFPSNNGPGANLPPITYTGNQNPNFNNNDPNSFPPITLFPNGYNAPAQGNATQPNQPQGLNRPPANQPGVVSPGFNPGQDQLPPITLAPAGNTNVGNPPIGLPGQGLLPGSNQPGLPSANQLGQPGFNPGLNQPGLNQAGLNQPGVNQAGLNQPGVNLQGLNQQLINQQLLNQQAGNPPNQQQLPTNVFPDPNAGQPPQPGINTPPQNIPGQNFQNGAQPPPGTTFTGFNPNPGVGPNPPGAGAAGQSALGIINSLLTTPRPPPPGIGPQSQQSGPTIGGGIAGIASKFEGPSIKSYGGQTDFSKWEFVFQLQGTGVGLPNSATGTPGATGATPGAGAPLGSSPLGAPPTGH